MIWNIENCKQPMCSRPFTRIADHPIDNAPQSWEIPAGQWEAAVRDLTWSLDDNRPRYRHLRWRQVFDDQLKGNPLSIVTGADPLFSMPLGESSVPFEIRLSKEDVWKRYRTISHINVLEGEKLEQTRKTFFEAMEDSPTDEQGRIAVHGYTVFAWTTKIPGEPLSSGG